MYGSEYDKGQIHQSILNKWSVVPVRVSCMGQKDKSILNKWSVVPVRA